MLILMMLYSNSVVLAKDLTQGDLALIINKFEQQYKIPSGLLHSIARVESQLNPYAVNISGKTIIAKTKQQALKIINAAINKEQSNIDIGPLQLNYYWHFKNFANLEEMLSPKHNIEYAARLLSNLYKQHQSWQKAVRFYHSSISQHHRKYSRKVLIAWLNS